MSAVPRKHEARVSGLERARIGAAAADARQGSAKADALERARSNVLRAFDLSSFATLAAANPDYSAKVLLELVGQGATGPCRTRAWIMRNGARIEKGNRGLAVSMFGGYVWPLRQTTGRFGSVGMSVIGEPSEAEVRHYWALCGGDSVAAGVVLATRGYAIDRITTDGVVDLERLELAVRRARGVLQAMPGCLSCDGAGCVLCSCLEGRSRIPVVDCSPVESVPTPEPVERSKRSKPVKRLGRPRAERPNLPDIALAMREVRRLRDEAERLRLEAAELERRAMAQAWKTHSLADIAAASGVTRARVHQIVKAD